MDGGRRRWANALSPEQIARRLPVDFPDDDTMRTYSFKDEARCGAS